MQGRGGGYQNLHVEAGEENIAVEKTLVLLLEVLLLASSTHDLQHINGKGDLVLILACLILTYFI